MQFQEAEFDTTALAMRADRPQRGSEADANLIVQFTVEPWQDKPESAKQGRPIYVEKDFILIMVPGDHTSIIHRPASQMDIDRFPVHYQRFKNKQDQRFGSGTPLRAVSFITQAQVKELEFFNVFTVEQLAAVPDVHGQKFMGIFKLKQLANDFLKAARETAPLTAMREEMERKDAQLKVQADAITDLQQRLKAMEEKVTAEA